MTMTREPHKAEHERSQEQRLQGVSMPKNLAALLRWYSKAWSDELPDALHSRDIWQSGDGMIQRGIVAPQDEDAAAKHGIASSGRTVDQGGSSLGTHAFTGTFRQYIEGSPGATDRDGYYHRPLAKALSVMSRSMPFSAVVLFQLAQCGFDEGSLGRRSGWNREMWEVYITEILRRLWGNLHDRPLRGLA